MDFSPTLPPRIVQDPGWIEPLPHGLDASNRPPEQRPGRGRWIVRGVAAALLLLILLVGWLAVTAPLSKSLQPIAPPQMTLLASDGTPIARNGAVVEAPVRVRELPAHVVEAFLAIEDRRFSLGPFELASQISLRLRSATSGSASFPKAPGTRSAAWPPPSRPPGPNGFAATGPLPSFDLDPSDRQDSVCVTKLKSGPRTGPTENVMTKLLALATAVVFAISSFAATAQAGMRVGIGIGVGGVALGALGAMSNGGTAAARHAIQLAQERACFPPREGPVTHAKKSKSEPTQEASKEPPRPLRLRCQH